MTFCYFQLPRIRCVGRHWSLFSSASAFRKREAARPSGRSGLLAPLGSPRPSALIPHLATCAHEKDLRAVGFGDESPPAVIRGASAVCIYLINLHRSHTRTNDAVVVYCGHVAQKAVSIESHAPK